MTGFADILGDITPGEIPLISTGNVAGVFDNSGKRDLFDSRRAAWHELSKENPRCDFAPGKAILRPKKPIFIHCLWRRSSMGRTLAEIKTGNDTVQFITANMKDFITDCIGHALGSGDWCIITPPPRRHKVNNFAQRIATGIASGLGVPFYPDCLRALNRQRVMATFELVNLPPQRNIIIFDDILTTGSTLQACHRALAGSGRNTIYFAAIDNE